MRHLNHCTAAQAGSHQGQNPSALQRRHIIETVIPATSMVVLSSAPKASHTQPDMKGVVRLQIRQYRPAHCAAAASSANSCQCTLPAALSALLAIFLGIMSPQEVLETSRWGFAAEQEVVYGQPYDSYCDEIRICVRTVIATDQGHLDTQCQNKCDS